MPDLRHIVDYKSEGLSVLKVLTLHHAGSAPYAMANDHYLVEYRRG